MRNAPGREAQGVECQSLTNTDAHSIRMARIQYLGRFGISSHRAAVIAPLAFGESAHG